MLLRFPGPEGRRRVERGGFGAEAVLQRLPVVRMGETVFVLVHTGSWLYGALAMLAYSPPPTAAGISSLR